MVRGGEMKRRTVLRNGVGVAATAALGWPTIGLAKDVGRPAKNPYKHKNLVAKLPAWDGRNDSESVPGSMRMFRGNLHHTYYGSG